LWARIKPLSPVVPRRADHPGRKRLDDRKVLSGILFVLYTGISWEFLPQELCSGMTCRLCLRDDIHEAFLSLAYGIVCRRRLVDLSRCLEFSSGEAFPGSARTCG
jgi:transposase